MRCTDLHVDSAPNPPVTPTLLASGPNGELATRALEAPWSAYATAQLDAPPVAIRSHDGNFYVVHADAIQILALDLTTIDTIALPGADARDIAFVGTHTAIVSQRARTSLARIDLHTRTVTQIDLSPLANASGLATEMLASCGAQVFVQLRRDQAPALAVLDVTDTCESIVGLVALVHPPAFKMETNCAAAELYVAEPVPLFEGAGAYQRVDLTSLTATTQPYADGLGELGGFVMRARDDGWFITHTEFGPSPSSHLQQITPSSQTAAWNSFAPAHIDRLALDLPTSQLFFPDSCFAHCTDGFAPGIQVFDAATGAHLSATGAIEVGFPPVDVVVAR